MGLCFGRLAEKSAERIMARTSKYRAGGGFVFGPTGFVFHGDRNMAGWTAATKTSWRKTLGKAAVTPVLKKFY